MTGYAVALPGDRAGDGRPVWFGGAKLAADLERQSPGILRKIADSMGMAVDFAKWEASHAA